MGWYGCLDTDGLGWGELKGAGGSQGPSVPVPVLPLTCSVTLNKSPLYLNLTNPYLK